MSFIHNSSSECAKEQLDIFSVPPTQLSLESSEIVVFKPVASLQNHGPIEFIVPPCSDEYTDVFSTMIYVVVSITDENGVAIAPNENVGVVNNILHSMFSNIDISIGNRLVSTTSNLYPFKAYLETHLNYSNAAKQSHQTLSLFYKDTAGKIDDASDDNKGYVERKKFFSNGRMVALLGKPCCDLFGQNKFLPNGVGLEIVLSRSKDSICLSAPNELKAYELKLHSAELHVRRVRPSADLLLAHARVLSHTTAKYALARVEVKAYTIPNNLQTYNLDNVIIGQLPVRILFCMINNTSLIGRYAQSPFNFQHFNLDYLGLTKDGVTHGRPFQPKFAGDHPDIAHSYYSSFAGVRIHWTDDGYDVDREEYAKGYCIHAWDLTSDYSADVHQWSLRRTGTIGFELRFSAPLATAISCIVYCEFQNILEIDADRRVSVDF
jgi:hypothetical protein